MIRVCSKIESDILFQQNDAASEIDKRLEGTD